MDKTEKPAEHRKERSYLWVLEVLLVVTITPALVSSIGALTYLPIV